MSPSCGAFALVTLAVWVSGSAAGDSAVSLVQVRAEVVQHAAALGATTEETANKSESHVAGSVWDLGKSGSGSTGETPGCDSEIPKERRLFLVAAAQPYHGSTALEGVIMSSSKLGTLCSYGRTQCEGGQIMMDDGFTKKHGMWDVERMLELYSDVWDLDKPVLLDKSPDMMYPIFKFNQRLEESRLPAQMQKVGIKKLDFAYTLMWRPICLGHLSSHHREAVEEKGTETVALTELDNLENFVENHKKVSQAGVPILVINFADIIWRPDYTTDRMEKFLPCLGPLDADYVPKLGKDVVKGNNWKAHGSSRMFGKSVDPSSFYSMSTGECHGEENLFSVLSDAEQQRADVAVKYLLSKS